MMILCVWLSVHCFCSPDDQGEYYGHQDGGYNLIAGVRGEFHASIFLYVTVFVQQIYCIHDANAILMLKI